MRISARQRRAEMSDHAPSPTDDLTPRAPSVVAFDIGEVLIDETRVWALWADLVGVSPLTLAATMGAAIAQGLDHEAAFDHLVPHIDWRVLAAEHEERLGGLTEADLYPDVADCLGAIADLGLRVVLAGNQPAIRQPQLASLNLRCETIITSEELGAEKPDRAFFEVLLERLSISDPSQVLYVGDRVDNDILPASQFGMLTCWLRRGPWGRLQDLPDDAIVDMHLEGLGELPLLLATWLDDQPVATETGPPE